MPGSYAVTKRALDIVVSLSALLVFLPFGLMIALLIRLETPGNVFFCQKRVGQYLKVFHMVKFRSMVSDASAKGPYWTSEYDSRITRVGNFLRRTSLDEIPQLWNVLIGDMSLIGPRPDTVSQQPLYSPEAWESRHRVKPGITGLAQVHGRSSITQEDRLRYDLAYAAAPNLKQDCSILWQTMQQVLRKVGVN